MVLARSLGSWQPNGHAVQSSECSWLHIVSSFDLIQFCLTPYLAPPSSARPNSRNSQETNTISLLTLQQTGSFRYRISFVKGTGKGGYPITEIGGERNGRGQNNTVGFFLCFFFFPKYMLVILWGCGKHRNSEEHVSEILVIYLKIPDSTNEMPDEENRKRKDDLVLGTINILSYVILTFSLFHMGKLRLVEWGRVNC